MPTEAKARVMRAAADTGRVLEDLNKQAAVALANLEQVTAAPLRRQIGEATELVRRYQNVATTMARAPAPAPVGGGVPAAPMPIPGPPAPGPSRSFTDLSAYGRPLTEEERQHYRRLYVETGQRTEQQLALARMHEGARGVIAWPRVSSPQPTVERAVAREPGPRRPEIEDEQPDLDEYVQRISRWTAARLAHERTRLEARLTPEALAAWGGPASEEGRRTTALRDAVREAQEFRTADQQERQAEPSAWRQTPPEHRQLGYTEEEIARAHELRPGTILIPPASSRPAAGGPEVPPSAAQLETPEGRSTAVQPNIHRAQEMIAAADAETQAVRHETEGAEALGAAYGLTGLSMQGLRREWKANQTELRQQDREYDTVTRRLDRLRDLQRRHPMREEYGDEMRRKTARLRDLAQGGATYREREQAIRSEAEHRGMRVEGGQLTGGGGGRGRGVWGVLTAGAIGGLGGGGWLGGGAAGLAEMGLGALGMGALYAAPLAGIAGLGVAKWYQAGQEYQKQQLPRFWLGMQLGRPPDKALGLRMAGPVAEGGLMIPIGESQAAMGVYAAQTGRTDIEGIMTLARASGMDPTQLAGLVGGVGALGVLPRSRTVTRQVPVPGAPTIDAFARLSQAHQDAEGWAALAEQHLHGGALHYRLTPGLVLPSRFMTVTDRVDIGGYLAAGYRRAGYLGGENPNAFRAPFFQQWANIAGTAAQAGGAPIAPEAAETMAGWLGTAGRVYGTDVNPAYGGQLVRGMITATAANPNATARGIMLRNLRNLSPEDKARIAQQVPGLDVSTLSGAAEALETAGELPGGMGPEGAQGIVMRATLGRLMKLVPGEPGRMMLHGTGMPFNVARRLQGALPELLGEKPMVPETQKDLEDYFKGRYKKEEAAGEAQLPENIAKDEVLSQEYGKSIALIGQNIYNGMLEGLQWLAQTLELQRSYEATGTVNGGMSVPTGAPAR